MNLLPQVDFNIVPMTTSEEARQLAVKAFVEFVEPRPLGPGSATTYIPMAESRRKRVLQAMAWLAEAVRLTYEAEQADGARNDS
jgi:ribosomal protein S7